MTRYKTIRLVGGQIKKREWFLQLLVCRNGTFKNRGRLILRVSEQRVKQQAIHHKNTPSRIKIHRRKAKAHNRNQSTPVELFPQQEGCDMHHINSNFVLPCLISIHEQPHICGDLLLGGWA